MLKEKKLIFAFQSFENGMRGELAFLLAEAPCIALEKSIPHQRVFEGYLTALDYRVVCPKGFDKEKLKAIAGWVLRNQPKISEKKLRVGKRSVKLTEVLYPENIPMMGTNLLISDESERAGSARVWLRHSNF